MRVEVEIAILFIKQKKKDIGWRSTLCMHARQKNPILHFALPSIQSSKRKKTLGGDLLYACMHAYPPPICILPCHLICSAK